MSKEETNVHHLHVHLEPATHEMLKILAKKNNRTIRGQVVTLIEKEIDRQEVGAQL